MESAVIKALKNRRSIYALGSGSPISDDEIAQLVKDAVEAIPSAFNAQTQSAVVLFGEKHQQLWQIVRETLFAMLPDEEAKAKTGAKLDSFAAGHGTVLFFSDVATVADQQKKFPLYADHFPQWADEGIGMLQIAVWAALEEAGLGVNLQHYNPLIDEKVAAAFDIPAGRQLVSQMVFGEVKAPAGEKQDSVSLEDRFKVLK